jgi:CRISPR-associated protein Csx14
VFHRVALGTAPLPFRQKVFQMNLGWPGKENQARCITTVEELTSS